ncbi:MAG: DinB family protein [Dehalococcoidales bacterium]|jgi:hypothetical protein
MELKEFLRMEIEGIDRGFKRVVDGLTQKEIEWQPSCGCNSIGLILFHIARSEDSFSHHDNTKQLWETGGWYTKLGMGLKDSGAHFNSADEVNCFKVPKLAKILAYSAAVRKQTLARLNKTKAADFDKPIKMPWGDMPMVMTFSFVVSHALGHIGEISYLRGMQRGMDK